jgi:hypothetical protein
VGGGKAAEVAGVGCQDLATGEKVICG